MKDRLLEIIRPVTTREEAKQKYLGRYGKFLSYNSPSLESLQQRVAEQVQSRDVQDYLKEQKYHPKTVFKEELGAIFAEGALVDILDSMWRDYVTFSKSELEAYKLPIRYILSTYLISGDLNSINFFLEAGVDPNGASTFTPDSFLTYAITGRGRGDRKIDMEGVIKLLHSFGADIHNNPHFPTTPISTAAVYGRVEAIKCLADLGASVNALCLESNDPLRTPLHFAILHENIDAAVVLVELGADLYAKDREGNSYREQLIKSRLGYFEYRGAKETEYQKKMKIARDKYLLEFLSEMERIEEPTERRAAAAKVAAQRAADAEAAVAETASARTEDRVAQKIALYDSDFLDHFTILNDGERTIAPASVIASNVVTATQYLLRQNIERITAAAKAVDIKGFLWSVVDPSWLYGDSDFLEQNIEQSAAVASSSSIDSYDAEMGLAGEGCRGCLEKVVVLFL